jgi:hypothetical protein
LYTSGLPVAFENFELTQVQQEATWKWETNCNMEVTNLLQLTYKSTLFTYVGLKQSEIDLGFIFTFVII